MSGRGRPRKNQPLYTVQDWIEYTSDSDSDTNNVQNSSLLDVSMAEQRLPVENVQEPILLNHEQPLQHQQEHEHEQQQWEQIHRSSHPSPQQDGAAESSNDEQQPQQSPHVSRQQVSYNLASRPDI